MKLLSKIAKIALRVTTAVIGLEPVLKEARSESGKTEFFFDKLEQVRDIIVQVELIGGALQLPGPDKLRAATPLVIQTLLKSDIVGRRKIQDPVLFKSGSEKIASGMADILNSFHEDGVDSREHG